MRRIILLAIALVVPACGPSAAPPPVLRTAPDRSFDLLLGLMKDRLGVMHDVARWKWPRKSPIEDPEREESLLRSVAEEGVALGLDPKSTRAFFRGQIEAAKILQRADFARWEADGRGPQGVAPDLVGVLRPRIDGLNRELLAALASVKPPLPREGATTLIRAGAAELLVGDGIDAEVRDMAIGSLLEARR